MRNRKRLAEALIKEVTAYTQARIRNDHQAVLNHLGRAHIISQYKWFNHLYIHFLMLEYSKSRKDWKEVRGQIVRIFATIPGHLFKTIPKGNTGWSIVPLTEKKPLPDDLKKLFD